MLLSVRKIITGYLCCVCTECIDNWMHTPLNAYTIGCIHNWMITQLNSYTIECLHNLTEGDNKHDIFVN